MDHICSFCNKLFLTHQAKNAHKPWCKLNLNNPIRKQRIKSKLERKKASERMKLFNKEFWSKERRNTHSKIMKEVVKRHPESYSKYNVCGRSKQFEGLDSFGNKTRFLSSYEKIVADWLHLNNIKWLTPNDGFKYEYNGERLYFPDFYLPELQLYIEVKGYETEKDHAKWKAFPFKLKILKANDIFLIKNNKFNL